MSALQTTLNHNINNDYYKGGRHRVTMPSAKQRRCPLEPALSEAKGRHHAGLKPGATTGQGNSWRPLRSKLEVDRELELARIEAVQRLGKACEGRAAGTIERVDLADVSTVEEVKRFNHEIQPPDAAEREVSHHSEVYGRKTRGLEAVSTQAERARGQREGVGAIGVNARQRINGPAGRERDDGGHLDVAEQAVQHSGPSTSGGGVRRVFLFPKREVKRAAEHKAVGLMVAREAALVDEAGGVLRLLVEVGRVVNGSREGVAGRKLYFVRESPVESDRKSVVGRA